MTAQLPDKLSSLLRLAALLTLCALAFVGGCACIALLDDTRCDNWTDTMVQRWEGCR